MISYLAVGCNFKSVSEARESSCWRARRTRARLICETKPKKYGSKAAGGVVEESDPSPFEGCLDMHQSHVGIAPQLPPVLSSAGSLGLLGLFGPLTLAEADTWAATVLVDEFDAGGL